MSAFTIFVIIVVIVAGALGWRAGFMRQIGQLAGIILGIVACRIFGSRFISWLWGSEANASGSILYTILAYIILFVVVYVIVTLLVRLLRNVLGIVRLGILDCIAGAVFRIVEWLLLLSLILNLWVALAPHTDMLNDSTFVRVLDFGPMLLGTDTAISIQNTVSSAITG